MVRRCRVMRSPRDISSACRRPGASVSGRGIRTPVAYQLQQASIALHFLLGQSGSFWLQSGEPEPRSVPFHLFLDAVGELFDLFGLLDHVHREGILTALADVFLQLGSQLEEFFGVTLN